VVLIMKTIKNPLISLALRTLPLVFPLALAAAMPAVAQTGAGLSFQPSLLSELLQEASVVELPHPTASSYLDQVSQFEVAYGPYDRRLAEPLQAAAVALEKAADPVQASQLYERALHVMRINDGLYSESQIAIVEKLIDCFVLLEDWAQVDRSFRYLHLLYTRLYESGSVELDRGLAQIADWHVIAINHDIGSDMQDHLREAGKLFRQRLTLAEKYGHTAADDVELLRRNLEVTQYNLRMMNSGVSAAMFSQLGARARDQLAQTD